MQKGRPYMPDRGPVLFVDDEASMRQAVTQWLELAGFEVIVRADASSALGRLSTDFPGVLKSPISRWRGSTGSSCCAARNRSTPNSPSSSSPATATSSSPSSRLRLGAYDFIEKPFVPERFLEIVRHAVEKRQLVIENRRLRRSVNERTLAARILGTSRAAESLRSARRRQLAGTDVSLILFGETGTGKDLIAGVACIDFGRRQKGNYVAVNCAAIPETMVESEFFGHEAGAFTSAMKSRPGKLEHASGGTLFLDEIDSMPLATQGKLLRALQERSVERLGSNQTTSVDLRAIASSKIDLRQAGNEGRFRLDLYYRLSVVELMVPPLRERKEDIPLLFEFFAASACTGARSRAAADLIRDGVESDGAGLARQCARVAQCGRAPCAWAGWRARRPGAAAGRGGSRPLARRTGRGVRAHVDRAGARREWRQDQRRDGAARRSAPYAERKDGPVRARPAALRRCRSAEFGRRYRHKRRKSTEAMTFLLIISYNRLLALAYPVP